MENEKFCSQLSSLKGTWDLGARGITTSGLSDRVDGSWRDCNLERKYPRLA
jgi:hypothetical protein